MSVSLQPTVLPSARVPSPQMPDEGMAILPEESPLLMPEQSLSQGRLQVKRHRTSPSAIAWRRCYLIGGTIGATAVATWVLAAVLLFDGLSVLEGCFLVLFVFLFAWIVLSFASALAGFFCVLVGAGRKLGIDPSAPLPTVSTRTALLMPTYHEDARRLFAGLQAIYESLAETGRLAHFDFYVLSDSRRVEIGQKEEIEFQALLSRLDAHGHLFYRRRGDNSGRKAGNVADWVRRFGGAYEQMIVLDADSVMSGDTIVRLVGGMEANPDVGLIQSLPEIIGGRTLFARMQQFSGRVYGPIVAHGVSWWHGAESNYWGHNAVIRTRAFADQAGLPALKGYRPFGGHVLSHDFVEAALIRRGGWATHMVPYLQGSYEEGPPTLTDLLIRDRRWCQGNLQHIKIVTASGLHWISRMHMLIGIGHYFTAPMWGALMVIGMTIPLAGTGLDLAKGVPLSLVRYWHGRADGEVIWIFAWTMVALLAPKFLGYITLLFSKRERRGCGGVFFALLSILFETILAALMAPVVMYLQSRGVFEVLAGKDSGWDAQQRDDGTIAWKQLFRRYLGVSLIGPFIGIIAYFVAPPIAAWMLPVIIGMALSIPVVAITSLRGVGDFFRRWHIFRIPEEITPPKVLIRAVQLRRAALDDAQWVEQTRVPGRLS